MNKYLKNIFKDLKESKNANEELLYEKVWPFKKYNYRKGKRELFIRIIEIGFFIELLLMIPSTISKYFLLPLLATTPLSIYVIPIITFSGIYTSKRLKRLIKKKEIDNSEEKIKTNKYNILEEENLEVNYQYQYHKTISNYLNPIDKIEMLNELKKSLKENEISNSKKLVKTKGSK